MTERRRPWWMLHWPSWLALVVFSGAFVVLNLTRQFDADVRSDSSWSGWPLTHCKSELKGEPGARLFGGSLGPWTWSGPISGWGDTGDTLTLFVKRSWRWNAVCLNLFIALAVTIASLAPVEKLCRRAHVRVTLRVALCAVGVCCAIAGVLTPILWNNTEMHWGVPYALTFAARTVICIAIGLASLTVLDFMGWLFGRLSNRETEE